MKYRTEDYILKRWKRGVKDKIVNVNTKNFDGQSAKMRGNTVAFVNLCQHVVVDNNWYNVTMAGRESVMSNVRDVKKTAETGENESPTLRVHQMRSKSSYPLLLWK